MLRGSVLMCALLFCGPSLWQALVDGTISLEAVLVRFLIAIPVAAVLLGLVRRAMAVPPSDGDVPQNGPTSVT